MREKKRWLIITFHTTAAAIAMEKLCRAKGLPGRLIPVPRELTADCGMAWRAGTEDRAALIAQAKEYLPQRTAHWSTVMGLVPAGIKITSARTRFGSCSGKNSICFSWRLMLYPPEAIDYVIVHELAHIRHHDHSPAFYALIAQYLPDWKARMKLLKE